MGLNYKILQYKNIVSKDGETFFDLGSETFDKDLKITGSFIIVNHMYIGRPDLISYAIYGTDEYADIICKINGISNPFELNENDLIFIPSMDYILRCCKVLNDTDSDFVESEDTTLNITIDNSVKNQKNLEERRSSWEQVKGDKNYVLDNTTGLIFY